MKNIPLFVLLLIVNSCMTIGKQRKVIFEPIALHPGYNFTLPPNTKEIFVPVAGNHRLNGLLYEKPGNTYLMVYFQGNAKNLQNFLDNHNMVLSWGYNVLVTDYRSFGKSTGKLTGQEQMYADADSVFSYALRLGYPAGRIILYGYSMGTSMAAYLASKHDVKAVVLESAYSSIPELDWVGNKAPAFELNTAQRAKTITSPTLLVHGEKDEVITPDHAQRIFDNLTTQKKKLVILQGGAHGNLKQRPEYKKMIIDFVGSN